MATALVDLYGGEDFEPFDRIILPEGYRPSDSEEFMCGKHRAYFLRKLKAWKEDIIEEVTPDHGAASGGIRSASRTLPTVLPAKPTGRSSFARATASAS